MKRVPQLVAALAATVLSAAFVIAGVAPAAVADDGDVTWSVLPANADGPDGRSWIEETLDPGQKVVEHLALRNLSDVAITFAIKAADGYITAGGRFNMFPSDKKSVDAGTWVTGPGTVQVGAGATAIVAFTIAIPENATPGDHAAGIAATVQSVGPSGDGNQIAIESRVGFPIMTRVTGELKPALSVKPVKVEYRISWNPFQPGTVTATYDLSNDGNVRIQAKPVVESQGHSTKMDKDAPAIELLPGENRKVTASISGVWPLFFAPVQVRIAPTVVTPDGDPQKTDAVVTDFGVWAIPVPQLLVLLALVLVGIAIWAGRRRSNIRMEALVAQAREAGRREIADDSRGEKAADE